MERFQDSVLDPPDYVESEEDWDEQDSGTLHVQVIHTESQDNTIEMDVEDCVHIVSQAIRVEPWKSRHHEATCYHGF